MDGQFRIARFANRKWRGNALRVHVCVIVFLLSRLYPSCCPDPSRTSVTGEDLFTVRFAPQLSMRGSFELAASSFTHPAPSRSSRLAVSRSRSADWLLLLLLLAGDIEVNPGPVRKWKYPCGVCSAPVKSNQRGIQCDVCANWLHTRCIGIANDLYEDLRLSDESWCCKRCLDEAVPFHDVSSSDSVFNNSANSIFNTTSDHISTCKSEKQDNSITIIHSNCRSLLPKIDHLRLLISSHSPNVVAITETWLDSTISNSELFIPGYQLVRRDRDRHGGGVGLYIRDNLSFSLLFSHPSAELLIVELNLRHSSMLCGVFYRPPSSDGSDLSSVETALEQLSPSKLKSLTLLGDFNIDRSPSSRHPLLNNIMSIEDKLGLKQIVTFPTRTTVTTGNLIDHVYISECQPHLPCIHLPPLSGSDHDTLLVTLSNCQISYQRTKHRKVWLFNKADFERANETLQCLPTSTFTHDNVNSFWTEWRDVFTAVISDTIPSKQIKPKTKVPYLTADLLHLVRKKSRLFRFAKQSGTTTAWSKYTKIRNRLTSALRSAKKAYFHQMAASISFPRDFWSSYHKLNPKYSRTPASLHHHNTKAITSIEKATLLNSFFTGCFTTSKPFLPNLLSSSPPSSKPTLSSVECTHEEVHHLLANYKINTASGPDGLSSKMLRGTAGSIAPALTTLFNLSLKLSTVPEDWKKSNITPIFKSGQTSEASNYRPISLLSLISKVLERCIHNRVMDFLLHNKLLSDHQFGFRPRFSTQDALLTATRDWHQSLTTHKQVAAVFFDVKKAFDSVPHDQLLKSLSDIGITGQLLKWFADYLTGRQQRVVLDGVASNYTQVTSGVPQGSILGPLLYIIFTNSISQLPLSDNTKCILYADDILLYKPINSDEDRKLLQNDCNSILNWVTQHGLSPNHSKTKLLSISRSRNAPPINLIIAGHIISPSPTVKYLGITLSSSLTWSDHVKSICKIAKRQLGIIHRKLHHAPPEVRCQIINSTILPKLDYCCAVWDPHHKQDILSLDSVQKFAGRIVTHNWHDNLSTIQSRLNWLPLKIRRRSIKLKLTYNIINNLSCLPPSTFIPHPSPSLRHLHDQILFKPYVPTVSHRHSFFIDVIHSWNSLPAHIVNSPSSLIFKSRIKSFFSQI